MAKTYEIKVVLDTSQPEAAARRGKQAVDEQARLQKKLADQKEKEAKRAAAAAARQAAADKRTLERTVRETQRSEEKQARDNKRAQDKVASETKHAAQRQQRETERVAKQTAANQRREDARNRRAEQQQAKQAAAEKQRLASKATAEAERERKKTERDQEQSRKRAQAAEDKYYLKEYRSRATKDRARDRNEAGPLARTASFSRRQLTDEQVRSAARNKVVDRQNKRRVDAAMKDLGEGQDSFAAGIASGVGLGGALTKAGGALLALEAGKHIVDGLADSLARARDASVQLGQGVLGTLTNFRAVASVEGKLPDRAFGEDVLKFGAETGLGSEGAARFRESFGGRAQLVRGKQISEGGYDQFRAQAATLAATKGINEDLAGELLGGVLKVENFKAKGGNDASQAAAATARATGAFKILDAGVGKIAVLAPQLNEVLASLTRENNLEGVFRNATEASAAVSVASEYDPGQASVTVQRTAQGLRDFDNKDKRRFFDRSKIKSTDSFFEALAKANTVIQEEVNKGVPVDTALEGFGFHEVRENRGLRTFFGARNTTLAAQLENVREATSPGADLRAQADLAAAKNTEVFTLAVAKATTELTKFQVGQKSADLELAKEQAEAEAVKRDSSPLTQITRAVRSALTGGRVAGRDIEIEEAALADLEKRAGVKARGGIGDIAGSSVAASVLGVGSLVPGVSEFFGSSFKSLFNENAGAAAELTKAAAALKQAAVPPDSPPAPQPPRAVLGGGLGH